MSISSASPAPPTLAAAPKRARVYQAVALGAILLLALFLHFYRLGQEGFANLYYAATVKSMLTSWRNFFYASFDPGGFVSVDKPPLGLWIQALSATIFGFSGWSLLLPQALAGVLSVALLYHLVARAFGAWAGIIAALLLTLSPISVAANRNNTMDSQLVLTSLLAAWAVSLAAERGKLRWLILCAVFVGAGFNIKMLQAAMVLPAFWLMYLVAAHTGWFRRIAHLLIATLVLAVVSLAWVVAVDLTPPDQRPFVGSSQNNSEIGLIIGHNGLERLGPIARWLGWRNAPRGQPVQPAQPSRGQPAPVNPPVVQPQPPAQPQPSNGPNDEIGAPGVLRLLNKQLAGQSSWFLPLAALGFFAAAFAARPRYPLAREHQQLLMWGLWLAPMLAFFSFAGLFHRYYLEMLAPAIAALAGAGIVALWRWYAQRNWRGLFLPLAILANVALEAVILSPYAAWNGWLAPLVIVAGALAATALIGLMLLPVRRAVRLLQAATLVAGLLALLIAPAIWSFTPLQGADTGLPFAGPELVSRQPRPANMPGGDRLIAFLRANRQGARFLVATLNANTAAPIILATGEPVMAIGGFGGNDHLLTAGQLAALIARNDVRFLWIPAQANQQAEIARWVNNNCARVQAFSPPSPAAENPQLYDCNPRRQ